MKNREKALIVLSIGIALLLPVAALAASGGLVPCGTGADVAHGSTLCRACDLVTLVQNILKFLIGLSIPVAVAMFAYAGVLYFTSGATSEKMITKARGIFSQTLIGFIIAISAWLMINTLLTSIVDKRVFPESSWFTIKCYTPLADTSLGKVLDNTLGVVTPGDDGTPSVPGTPVAPGTPGAAGGTLTDAEARAALAAKGITINKTAAAGTSLEGIQASTLNQIIALQQSCGCSLVVTGGTESGVHADGVYSHETGYKVDLSLSDPLNTYITNTAGAVVGVRGDGATTYTVGNTVYALESDHWDVLVKP